VVTAATIIFPLAAEGNPLEHVVDHAQWAPGGWYLITNHMLVMILAAVAMLLVFPWITKRYRSGELVPTGTRNLFEAIMIYVRDDVARPTLGHETDRFMPFLWTLFFFILFNNLIGLLPLDQLTGWFMEPMGLHPIFGTATANIWVTGTLALVAFIVMQISGIRANGFVNYCKHFTGGAPAYMAPLMVPLEIIGMLIKPFSLAIRLFANMNAGHILLAVLLGFVLGAFQAFHGGFGSWGIAVPAVLGSVAIMCLELFVAFLQAYIFTFLTSLFIAQLVVHEHEHENGEGGHHDERHETLGGGDLTDGEELPDAARQAGAHMAG
jgi:F-type H+-transporting ATPase subunit a